MNLIQILEKDGIPARTSGSFADSEYIPSPIWIFTNMGCDNYSADNNVQFEVLHYTIALYSQDPKGLRDKVKAKQKELIAAGAFCSGIIELRATDPLMIGYGFECNLLQKY